MGSRTDDAGSAYKGSQLQTQIYVNSWTAELDSAIRQAFPDLQGASGEWRSPLAGEKYAEYAGEAFLRRLGLDAHAAALSEFWPARGPQWDALALVHLPGSGTPGVLLGEGKSYPGEMLDGAPTTSPPETPNRDQIDAALKRTREQLDVSEAAMSEWSGALFQNANRLAHLLWLRERGVQAWLVHLLFTGDPVGRTTGDEWKRASGAAEQRLGLPEGAVEWAGHVILPAGSRQDLPEDVGARAVPGE